MKGPRTISLKWSGMGNNCCLAFAIGIRNALVQCMVTVLASECLGFLFSEGIGLARICVANYIRHPEAYGIRYNN